MNKITSFTIDHIRLIPGIYVSRKDSVNGHIITTFDIRMTSPNDEPVMNTAEIHTIEHLGATFLRNHEVYKDQVIYFGPMGCRTGFYLLPVSYTHLDVYKRQPYDRSALLLKDYLPREFQGLAWRF